MAILFTIGFWILHYNNIAWIRLNEGHECDIGEKNGYENQFIDKTSTQDNNFKNIHWIKDKEKNLNAIKNES